MDPSFKNAPDPDPSQLAGMFDTDSPLPACRHGTQEPDPAMVDSLADLFLGDGPLSPEQQPASRTQDTGPRLRLVDHRPDAFDSFEEFATNDKPQAPHAPHALDATIEAVVLGHLPVIAPAWALQHAASRANELGEPVALVRLAGPSVNVELLAPTGQRLQSPSRHPASLPEALHWAASRARTWMIRVDDTSEASLAEASDLDTITVLTGADDAAVVACYRTLKAIDHDLRFTIGDDEDFPELRVAVMGSDPKRSSAAASKLTTAASKHLGISSLETSHLSRMQAVQPLRVFTGECHDPAPVLIAAIRDALDSAEPAAQQLRESTFEPAAIEHVQPESIFDDPNEIVFDDRWDDEPTTQPHTASHTGTELPAQEVEARSTSPSHSHHTTDAGEFSPASLVPGLTPLSFECPHAPRVELAVDAAGRLHLVALDADDASIVGELTRAKSWAIAHASLLQAAEPRLKASPTSRATALIDEPTLHVLTDRSELVRTLIETDVRVHLLAHASTANHGWVVRPING